MSGSSSNLDKMEYHHDMKIAKKRKLQGDLQALEEEYTEHTKYRNELFQEPKKHKHDDQMWHNYKNRCQELADEIDFMEYQIDCMADEIDAYRRFVTKKGLF